MVYVVVLLVAVGTLAAANLLLSVGVIRRLREHTEQLAQLSAPLEDSIALPPGSVVPDFTASTVDGRVVTAQSLGDRAFIGFFSPHCPACSDRLPAFKNYVLDHPHGNASVIAVAAGSVDDTKALVSELSSVAEVVVEPDTGSLHRALSVTGYPAFLRLERGSVTASGYDLAAVTAAISAVALERSRSASTTG